MKKKSPFNILFDLNETSFETKLLDSPAYSQFCSDMPKVIMVLLVPASSQNSRKEHKIVSHSNAVDIHKLCSKSLHVCLGIFLQRVCHFTMSPPLPNLAILKKC